VVKTEPFQNPRGDDGVANPGGGNEKNAHRKRAYGGKPEFMK
jgi:hypothetical protein